MKKLEKEKEEENKKYKQKEEENDEEEKEKEKNIGKNLSKKEKNKLIELKQIKEYYIGKEGPKIIKKKENKPKEMIKDFFVFDWKDTEDTTNEKKNFLPKMTPKIMFGKGIVGGLENKDDMKDYYNFDEEERKKQLFRLKKRKNDENKSISESVSDNEHRKKYPGPSKICTFFVTLSKCIGYLFLVVYIHMGAKWSERLDEINGALVVFFFLAYFPIFISFELFFITATIIGTIPLLVYPPFFRRLKFFIVYRLYQC